MTWTDPSTMATAREPVPEDLQYDVDRPLEPSAGAMVRLPGGTFTMGSDEEGEGPRHTVTLRAFSIDVTEVTAAAFAACVDAGGCAKPIDTGEGCNYGRAGRGRHPMNCVAFDDADRYCAWAGKRLPTEAEWEFAARGVEGRAFPWGNSMPRDQLCWKHNDQIDGTCEVGAYVGGNTPDGVNGLAGNVLEWTSTQLCRPYGSNECLAWRVQRGGSYWANEPAQVRATARDGHSIMSVADVFGFRCARS